MMADTPDDPRVVIFGGGQSSQRRRGRPRAEVTLKPVTTWVPTPLADTLCQLANKHDVSVSSIVRQIVVFQLTKLKP